MRFTHYCAAIGLFTAVIWLPTARAIDSADTNGNTTSNNNFPATSVVAGAPWFVGRVQQSTTPANQHNGTGSYIRPNITLTASHVLNELVQPGADRLQMRYQDFQLDSYGAQQYPGLGVMDPLYSPGAANAAGQHDVGLIITLDMPEVPGPQLLPPQPPILVDAPLVPPGGTNANPNANPPPALPLTGANFPVLAGNQGPDGVFAPLLPDLPVPRTNNPADYPNLYISGYTSSVPGASAVRTGGVTYNIIPSNFTFGSQLNPPAPNPPNQQIPKPAAPFAAYTQPGDSGGPWWNLYDGGQYYEILGTTSYGDIPGANGSQTLSVAAYVPADLPFLNGDGVPGGAINARQIDEFVLPPGIPTVPGHALIIADFNAAANWEAGSQALAQTPGTAEIAVINPLAQYDANTIVVVSAATAQLDGLVNNANIQVNGPGALLDVSFSFAGTGGSGTLNGGIISTNTGGVFNSAWKFDNEVGGVLLINSNSSANIGYSNPNTVGDTVVHNGAGSLIQVTGVGASFLETHRMDNQGGQITVTNQGVMNCGSLLPTEVQYLTDSYSTSGAPAPAFEQPIVVDNGLNDQTSLFTVEGGSSLVCGNASATTVFLNEEKGTVAISGGGAVATTVFLDSLDNFNTVTVTDNASLTTLRYTQNEEDSDMTVSGGANGAATLASGPLINDGDFTIGNKGIVTAGAPSVLLPATGTLTLPTKPFTNGTDANFNVNAGGSMTVNGTGAPGFKAASNLGTITITGNLSAGSFQTNNGDFYNEDDGVITFKGKVQSVAEAEFSNSDLITTGAINGTGTLRFTGASSYLNQAVTPFDPDLDTRKVAVIFDDAIDDEAPVTMEAATEDGGKDPDILFDDPSSIYDLSVIHGSLVKLVDDEDNSDTGLPEAIYTLEFGVDATSTLDLNGINVYYYYLDPSEGGLSGTIELDGGHLIQLPEPASLSILGLLPMLAMRRSRRK